MGYDLTGSSGNHFRSNVWSFRPIVRLMACSGVLTDEDVRKLSSNGGEFIDAEKANAIAAYLEGLDLEEVMDTEAGKDKEKLRNHKVLEKTGMIGNIKFNYRLTNKVPEFIKFCRESKGFWVS